MAYLHACSYVVSSKENDCLVWRKTDAKKYPHIFESIITIEDDDLSIAKKRYSSLITTGLLLAALEIVVPILQ